MKSNTLRRLFAYTLRYKWSFLVSIFGFLTFAAADIAAVEWLRRIIAFINSDTNELHTICLLYTSDAADD